MPDKIAELRRELSIANHILANEDVVDAFGHISVRHPEDPIATSSRAIAPPSWSSHRTFWNSRSIPCR